MSTPPNPVNAITMEELKAMHEAARQSLGVFIATGALYVHFPIPDAVKDLDGLPRTIQLHCGGDCGKEQTFERYESARGTPSHGSDHGWGRAVCYQCRNCKKKQQMYMYVWKEDGFWKVGQIPELRETIDPRLKKALGDSSALYRKAVRSRSFGFGIGAVSYLRRIVEDKTDVLVDLLKDEKWDTWDEAERAELDEQRAGAHALTRSDGLLPEEISSETAKACTAGSVGGRFALACPAMGEL